MKAAAFKAAVALAVASVLPAGQAVADYDSCMKWCMKEHSFSHCNLQCGLAGGGKNTGGKEPAGRVEHCETSEEDKVNAFGAYLREQHGKGLFYSVEPTDNPDFFKVDFDISNEEGKWIKNCIGTVTFTKNCDLLPEYECGDLR